ncbi:MAG: hypothetical protein ACRD82_13530 [Blastocatellia bacterium]
MEQRKRRNLGRVALLKQNRDGVAAEKGVVNAQAVVAAIEFRQVVYGLPSEVRDCVA